jgi:excisionase family DNA binding protein
MPEQKKWLTVDDVAAELLVSPRTVYRWLTEGRLKGKNLGGRAGWRIRQEDFDRFVEELPGAEGKATAERPAVA